MVTQMSYTSTTCPHAFYDLLSIDGASVGIVLGSASEEELRELDHLLSLMADFRVAEEDTGKQTSRGGLIEREVNFVHALLSFFKFTRATNRR